MRVVGAVLSVMGLVACTGASDSATAEASRSSSADSTRATPLDVVEAPIPRFRVPRYDTRGMYPRVHGDNRNLVAVNAALLAAIRSDQAAYAPSARRYARTAGKSCRGVYETRVDRRLLSASTVVVSALLPATTLYPCANTGKGWLAVTIRVPSGAPIRITDLFTNPSRGLRVLADAWKSRVRSADPELWRRCVRIVLSQHRPTARNYRYFALTTRGLAVGFPQAPGCNRYQAAVPYASIRPYLSDLGATLVAGVRRPR